jgi:phenylacetate-coenzyme A ligase PaaK-like adenylate-forming protein
MPRLTHSVIAFAILRQGFLSDEVRELFWRVFKVPVFGQILSPGGALLAWECEAHEGFHFNRDCAVFQTQSGGGEPELLATSLVDLRRPVIRLATALTGSVEYSTCGCGQSGPRLMGLRRRLLVKANPAAAFAACAAGC